jgi:hypothetical protein
MYMYLSLVLNEFSSPWGVGHGILKKGERLCPKGDNSKRVKLHLQFLKIFSRTSRPISIKLGTNHPSVKGILNCSSKGTDTFQRGDNHKIAKMC